MANSTFKRLGIEELDPFVETSAEAVVIANADGIIEFVNPAFEAMTGYSRGEVTGLTPAILKSGEHGVDFYRDLWSVILRGEVFRGTFVNRKKGGDLYCEEKVIIPFVDTTGKITHFVSTGRDVTRRLQKVEQLKRRATHDTLTNLPNRSLFMDRLTQTVKRAARHSEGFVLAIADIDGFTSVNETFGNAAGDALLLSVAFQIRQRVRDVDTVARLGGDEFGVILTEIGNKADAVKVFEKIAAALPSAVGEEHRPLKVTLSIGACNFPSDGGDEATLLHRAGAAMYKTKRAGGNGYSFFGSNTELQHERRRHESEPASLQENSVDPAGMRSAVSASHR